MRRNFTSVTEFILLGLSSTQELEILFFMLFFTIYMVTVAGNLGIIVLISGSTSCLSWPLIGTWQFATLCFMVRRRQWHPTPVLLPEKSHGRRSLVGCSPWGH
ncbi:hypothetical protein FD754_009395 [Muntiacus muntjak]|uniref:G-protein coupled receptors family 1 profile domain-containing protein n=1 Tax=Muntiacus muntjak TaxID=9888 RepID=A0A5N3WTN0_MUNMU|nr:hypothetical protein FD754_009395 [Muntiacus muntjak]